LRQVVKLLLVMAAILLMFRSAHGSRLTSCDVKLSHHDTPEAP
jgi:hypothetical protein